MNITNGRVAAYDNVAVKQTGSGAVTITSPPAVIGNDHGFKDATGVTSGSITWNE